MTVYVDDARIPATVGGRMARWSHMTADTKEELHKFAERLGLRRAYFQTCKANARRCPPETCPHWHYDVTETKRAQALKLGAVGMDIRKWADIIATRKGRT